VTSISIDPCSYLWSSSPVNSYTSDSRLDLNTSGIHVVVTSDNSMRGPSRIARAVQL
jgi:hypothetical protein